MIKKTITYTDFNDIEHTEDFFFNLTQAEVLRMQIEADGDFLAQLQKIKDNQDPKEMIKVFEMFINNSYGEKSPDGKLFVKSVERTRAFQDHAAYDVFFKELLTNLDMAAAFVNGLFPKDMQAAAAEAQGKTASQIARERSEAQFQGRRAVQPKVDTTPTLVKQPDLLTVSDEDLVQPTVSTTIDPVSQMSPEELQAFARQHIQSNTQ